MPVPEGRQQLRCEFEVTGKPKFLKGKGTWRRISCSQRDPSLDTRSVERVFVEPA
jgi:hypothetical protein